MKTLIMTPLQIAGKCIQPFKISSITISLLFLLLLSSCLKTRSQLRGNEAEDIPEGQQGRPVSAQIQDLNTSGVSKGVGASQSRSYEIDELKLEITRLTGRIEDLERLQKANLDKKPEQVEQLSALQNRVTELESAQALLIEALKKSETEKPKAEPLEDFTKGRSLYRAQDYINSIEHLSLYMKQPNPAHMEEATYLRANAYFNIKQYKKAIVDFSKIPEKYNRSRYMPEALLKIGQSFEAMGMKEDAKGFYQELVEKYPKSPEAKKVKIKK